ncbi:MAG: lysoplasmalogenase [Candidatus Marinimicrobia bacterium]|nr:lysoplasmalogenase [Candidatus Neomarinimicrobiota bacterium]
MKHLTKQTYLFKPLTLVIIILFAFFQVSEVSLFYKVMIISGLAFSMLGDIMLMLPTDKFLHGLASFLLAHILYISAFVSDSTFPVNYLYLIPLLIIGALILRTLLPRVGGKTVPVVLYSLILVMLLWQSIGRVELSYGHSSFVALIGSIFFISSDVALVLNRFIKKHKDSQLLILSTYYIAQLLIAYSI